MFEKNYKMFEKGMSNHQCKMNDDAKVRATEKRYMLIDVYLRL